MEGEVGDDADFPRLREQYEKIIIDDMREAGYVPVLGLGPFWATVYNKEKNKYQFVLSVHGYRVGRRLALTTEGITEDGKAIPRSTQKAKSSQSSNNVE